MQVCAFPLGERVLLKLKMHVWDPLDRWMSWWILLLMLPTLCVRSCAVIVSHSTMTCHHVKHRHASLYVTWHREWGARLFTIFENCPHTSYAASIVLLLVTFCFVPGRIYSLSHWRGRWRSYPTLDLSLVLPSTSKVLVQCSSGNFTSKFRFVEPGVHQSLGTVWGGQMSQA